MRLVFGFWKQTFQLQDTKEKKDLADEAATNDEPAEKVPKVLDCFFFPKLYTVMTQQVSSYYFIVDYDFLQLKKKQSSRAAIPDVSALDFKSEAKTSDGKLWNKKFASWNINGIRAWLEVA